MSRYYRFVVACAACLVLVVGCQRTVDVRTGTRVDCKYGHVISEDIKTISVPQREAGSYSVKNETAVCEKHQKLAALYAEAQQLIADGKLDDAAKKLTVVVEGEATFGNAASQLDTIKKGGKPTTDGGSGNTGGGKPTKPGGDNPTGPAQSLQAYTPDTIEGFKAGRIISDVVSVTRVYTPTAAGNVLQLTIVAEQFRDADAASRGLTANVKRPYGRDSATFKIGSTPAYFGTDGRRFAIVGMTKGSVLVALEMGLANEGSPKDLKGQLVKIAGTLP